MKELIKIEIATDKETSYGKLSEEDIKAVTAGYKFNGLFYERKNGKYIFIVK